MSVHHKFVLHYCVYSLIHSNSAVSNIVKAAKPKLRLLRFVVDTVGGAEIAGADIAAPSHSSSDSNAQTATTSSASAVTESQFCEVCLIAPREGFALVPSGQARFCENCAMRVAEMDAGCPVCRGMITMVMRIFH